MSRTLALALIASSWMVLTACGGGSTPPAAPAYPLVQALLPNPDLLACEPFLYDSSSYPDGVHGQEGGIGFAGPWNDADGDVTERIIGAHTLSVASDMAPSAAGGRSIQFGTTGTSIFREFAEPFGADGTTIWVSYRWITTDTAAGEGLQVVDFNGATGGFGCLVGQLRGLAGDDPNDGMVELGDHASRVSADIAARDQAAHFVLLRFTFGAGDADEVACWWDPMLADFEASMPDASIRVSDASFSRITLRSGSATQADSIDELYIGTTVDAVTTAADHTAVYRVGNSLTWDSQPMGIEALAGQAGYLHIQGHHINCGNTLPNIVANPAQVCVMPVGAFGTWDAALRGSRWDAVTCQPHPGPGSTLAADEASILALIAEARANAANADARFYVYAAWPGHADIQGTWSSLVDDADDTPTIQARAYFTHLIRRLRAATDALVYVIPVGEVLFQLDAKLRAGDVPGLSTIADLYRDDIHLSYDLGRFVAGVTTYATIHARDPRGLMKPAGWYGGSTGFTPAFLEAVHTCVWDVVSRHPYSGVQP